ncbi:sarcosine oxidase subunit alpha family protein [Tepidamorphus sp. 3E244]|uniref:sarcosine oxidase subunit alpha family protein n=1 Tax=Tepidamorphus sp. 3E244 TaxID=3385498 RepID=UPI0038FC7E6D
MTGSKRLSSGGRIDRSRPLWFKFNGKSYRGFEGDTLASALIANGVHLVARSMKYHRPRGIMTAGSDEPNAMVQLAKGARTEPNIKATQIPLYEGLEAASVNVFPSVENDVGSVNSLLSPFMTAGFYYKTFMPSQKFWDKVAEPMIRRAAGFGKAPTEPDPDVYDHKHVHCDVMVVGGGAAGLSAARAAAATGARVILADEQAAFGGSLLTLDRDIDGKPAADWVADTVSELESHDAVRLLKRTTVAGLYDQNYLVAIEQRIDDLTPSSVANPRMRVWHIRAKEVIVAAGSHERPLVFADNDRPGTMLASAALTYMNRYGVLPCVKPVIITNNDWAYETARAFVANKAEVVVADTRKSVGEELLSEMKASGVDVITGATVTEVVGKKHIKAVKIGPVQEDGTVLDGEARRIDCDGLIVSGGYSAAVHLYCHVGGKLRFDNERMTFMPAAERKGVTCVGGSAGDFALSAAMDAGIAAGRNAAIASGFAAGEAPAPVQVTGDIENGNVEPAWLLPCGKPINRVKAKFFVDYQNDTGAADIALAVREGFDNVEHMKRYTLTGFGTDQGKLGNINGLAILAELTGRTIEETGTTTFRPPYTPVTFGALAGRDAGDMLDPVRVTNIHDWHVSHGAEFENVGQWKRPWYYPRDGETMHEAVARECRAARTAVTLLDASTLGKIDVSGKDAGEFLDRVYTNMMLNLKVGSVRYGLMLKEDGMVYDDGTVTRIAEDRFLATTTTGGAAAVFQNLEDYLQTEWPDLDVYLTSVTEQWATVTVSGPKARATLERLTDVELDPETFPFMTYREGEVAGLPARIFRISFTGELSFEISVAWYHGRALWESLMEAGRDFGITPYGTETMHVLRAEKGFIIVGQETDGTMTPIDLGMNWIVSKKKPDFIGKRSLSRPDTERDDRKHLVGLLPEDSSYVVPEGAQLVDSAVKLSDVKHFDPPGLDGAPIYGRGSRSPIPMLGHVTSSYWSDAMGRSFALAVVKRGRERMGDTIYAPLNDRTIAMRIVDPVFYDKEGARRDG